MIMLTETTCSSLAFISLALVEQVGGHAGPPLGPVFFHVVRKETHAATSHSVNS